MPYMYILTSYRPNWWATQVCHSLVSFPFVVFSGEMAFKEYSSPVYTPLAKHVFSTIEMYITDSAGRPVPFSSGKVTVLLHFKQKDD